MAGVQHSFLRMCGVADGIGNFAVGKLYGKYHRQLRFFHLIDEKGDGGRISFGLCGAACEGGIISKSIGVSQIAEGETIPE